MVVAGVDILGSPIEQERPRTGGDAVRCCPGELKKTQFIIAITLRLVGTV